jgi:hypothetical protein
MSLWLELDNCLSQLVKALHQNRRAEMRYEHLNAWMTKLHSIYVITLNNETEFITEILEEMETWIFQTSGHRSVEDRSNTEGLRYGMV